MSGQAAMSVPSPVAETSTFEDRVPHKVMFVELQKPRANKSPVCFSLILDPSHMIMIGRWTVSKDSKHSTLPIQSLEVAGGMVLQRR